ncbi:DNA/RNA non-specific endonuclease [Asanoa sp. NPDC049518]|uniref:DNA/RNA non-specific endonuclease n=1 Tax=unclassified Asanoa TaxID=2685164 RepID=UPI00342959F8
MTRPGTALRVDPDYASRPGFDDKFLGLALPLPEASAGPALRYHHFSVVMHPARRLALFAAANVDGSRRFTQVPSSDRWSLDPRLPATAQVGNALYSGNDLDRGHLNRRADMLWGETRAEATAAVADTYHYTNCAPQHRDFNQNNATWQGLEDYILAAVADHRLRANVYTGPIFHPHDPIYREVRIPRAYWKVVAVATTEAVHATAYLIEQTDLLDALEREAEQSPLGPYRTYQIQVSDAEARTGIDFGPLRTFDPMRPPARDAEQQGPVELRKLGDVRLS